MTPDISVILPVYNESAQLHEFVLALKAVLLPWEGRYEIIIVDDGSRDSTWDVIRNEAATSSAIRAVQFSRNYGKEHAMCAGLDLARGKSGIIMDSDFQHPVELVPQMIRIWEKGGADIVEGVKKARAPESWIHRLGAEAFYGLLSRLARYDLRGATDYKLMDRKVIEAWKRMGERLTFFRGMAAWLGFRRDSLYFAAPERRTGKSGWTLMALVRLAINGLTSFTSVPLRFVTFLGVFFFCFALGMTAHTVIVKVSGRAVSGFATVIILLLVVGSVVMLALGIIGEYIANIYEEVKRRPRYIIREVLGGERHDS